jgi:hypothetical protein
VARSAGNWDVPAASVCLRTFAFHFHSVEDTGELVMRQRCVEHFASSSSCRTACPWAESVGIQSVYEEELVGVGGCPSIRSPMALSLQQASKLSHSSGGVRDDEIDNTRRKRSTT